MRNRDADRPAREGGRILEYFLLLKAVKGLTSDPGQKIFFCTWRVLARAVPGLSWRGLGMINQGWLFSLTGKASDAVRMMTMIPVGPPDA